MKLVFAFLLVSASMMASATEKIDVTYGEYPSTIQKLMLDAQDILLDKAKRICNGLENVKSLKGVTISIKTWDFADAKFQSDGLLLHNPDLTVTGLLDCTER